MVERESPSERLAIRITEVLRDEMSQTDYLDTDPVTAIDREECLVYTRLCSLGLEGHFAVSRVRLGKGLPHLSLLNRKEVIWATQLIRWRQTEEPHVVRPIESRVGREDHV